MQRMQLVEQERPTLQEHLSFFSEDSFYNKYKILEHNKLKWKPTSIYKNIWYQQLF